METFKQDRLESFIRENRDKFEVNNLPEDHTEKFLFKLNKRIKHFISIVPYLIKVAVATILVFTFSIIVWNNFIRKDRNEITLKNKIALVINKIGRNI